MPRTPCRSTERRSSGRRLPGRVRRRLGVPVRGSVGLARRQRRIAWGRIDPRRLAYGGIGRRRLAHRGSGLRRRAHRRIGGRGRRRGCHGRGRAGRRRAGACGQRAWERRPGVAVCVQALQRPGRPRIALASRVWAAGEAFRGARKSAAARRPHEHHVRHLAELPLLRDDGLGRVRLVNMDGCRPSDREPPETVCEADSPISREPRHASPRRRSARRVTAAGSRRPPPRPPGAVRARGCRRGSGGPAARAGARTARESPSRTR